MITAIIPYVLAFGAGSLAVYLAKPKPTPTPTAVPTAVKTMKNGVLQAASTSRWTSGYHGPVNGVYPGAMVSEALFQNYNKSLIEVPYQASETDGDLVTID